MKNIKNLKILIPLIVLCLFIILIVSYKPIKTNYIYSKELVFDESNLIDNRYKTIDDSKLVKKAEEHLQNIFSDTFDPSMYISNVIYNGYSYQYSNETTSVQFINSNNYEQGYSLEFNLQSGKMISLYKVDDFNHSGNGDTLSKDTLENIAKDFLFKLTDYTEEDFNNNDTIFNSYFTFDKSSFGIEFTFDYEFIHIHLDAISGEFVNYQNIILPSYDYKSIIN